MIDGQRLEIWSGGQRLVIDRKKVIGTYQSACERIVVRQERGSVALFVGDRRLEMTTPIAVKVGFSLCKNGGSWLEPDDAVLFEISGIEILLLPEIAVRVGGAILRKADRADDWQRETVH